MITNLLSNAAKISVSDQGSGIPKEFKERIFGRFSQADGSDTRRKGGSGLGLNISKSIIEKHDGIIGYESEVGVGSTFFFYLPVLDKQPDFNQAMSTKGTKA